MFSQELQHRHSSSQSRGAQIFQNCRIHLTLLGTIRVKCSKFDDEDPEILGATIKMYSPQRPGPWICASLSFSTYGISGVESAISYVWTCFMISCHWKNQFITNRRKEIMKRHASSFVSTFLKVLFEERIKVRNNFQHAEKVCLYDTQKCHCCHAKSAKNQLRAPLFAGYSDHTLLLVCTAHPYSYQEILSCLLLLFSWTTHCQF